MGNSQMDINKQQSSALDRKGWILKEFQSQITKQSSDQCSIIQISSKNTKEGSWQKRYETGSGLLVNIDGEVYEGEFVKKKAHRKGKYFYKDGRIYDGYWQNDKKHGYGVEIFTDESKYQGQFAQGQRTGLGTQIQYYEQENLQSFRNISKYVGEWNNNQMSGYGTILYNNGRYFINLLSIYTGYQNNNQRDGYGEYIKSNGDSYKGHWKNDQYSENGSDKSEKQLYIGQFRNGEFSGHGIKFQSNQLIYCGQFNRNQQHGDGVQINENQNLHKGFWMNDRAEGIAILKNQLIDKKQIVSFYQDQIVGEGTLIQNSGLTRFYSGAWRNSKMSGYGIQINENGQCYQGFWKDGVSQGIAIIKQNEKSIYIGEFSENSTDGEGTFIFKSEQIYCGCWINGKRIGYGVEVQTNCWQRKGLFIDDNLQGIGIGKYINGDSYIGGFSENKFNGEGTYIWKMGQIYSGCWSNQNRTGYGYQIDKNRQYYEGFWKDDKRQGIGIDKFITQDKYIGGFSENEQNDEGIHIWKTGEIYLGKIIVDYINRFQPKILIFNYILIHNNQQISYKIAYEGGCVIDLSPDNNYLVFPLNETKNRQIIVYNIKLRQLVGNWRSGHNDSIRALKYSHDGGLIASGSGGDHYFDCSIRIWNSQTQKQVSNTLKGHKRDVLSLAFSANLQRLASGSLDHSIRIWDWQKGITLFILKPEYGHIQQLAYSNNGNKLLFGGEYRIGIFDNAQCQPTLKFKMKTRANSYLYYIENEKIMMSANYNGRSIYFSRADNGKLIDRLVTKGIFSLGHLPNRRSLAFRSVNQLSVVDVTTRKKLRRFLFRDDWFSKLNYSTDSKYLVLLNMRGNIFIQPLYFI